MHQATKSSFAGMPKQAGEANGELSVDQRRVTQLEQELEKLKAENRELRVQVAARGGQLRHYGKLSKWSQVRGRFPWQSYRWRDRFVQLYDNKMVYFEDEHAAGGPRGQFALDGCIVWEEGRKKAHYWTFNLVRETRDRETVSMLRCSTEVRETYERWIQWFKKLELTVEPSQLKSGQQPPRAADIRPKSLTRAGSTASLASSDAGYSVDTGTPQQKSNQDKGAGYTSHSEQSDSGSHPRPGSSRRERPRSRHTGFVVHTQERGSVLSRDRFFDNVEGLQRVVNVMLCIVVARLIMDHHQKYPLRVPNVVKWLGYIITPDAATQMSFNWSLLAAFVVVSYVLQYFGAEIYHNAEQGLTGEQKKGELSPPAALRRFRERVAWADWLVVLVQWPVTLLWPGALLYRVWMEESVPPVPGLIFVLIVTVLTLKLHSFAEVNRDLRAARRNNEIRLGERGSAEPLKGIEGRQYRYPENVTVAKFLYFIAAPTLVYQVAYPRTRSIRWGFMLRYTAYLLAAASFGLWLTDQFIATTMINACKQMTQVDKSWGSFIRIFLERILKLALPTLGGFLVIFVAQFHLLLNLIAELLGFADREFYLMLPWNLISLPLKRFMSSLPLLQAWWNAESIGDYWALWNMPVHHWIKLHVYTPIRARCGRMAGSYLGLFASFLLSAAMHEIVIAVPLHKSLWAPWAFIGMLGQIPLIALTNWLKKRYTSHNLGNWIFWITFSVLGQPLCMLLYACVNS